MTAPAPSPAEQQTIDRFDIFAEERVVEEVARAIRDEAEATKFLAVGFEGEQRERIQQQRFRRLAAAAVAAYRAQDGGAEA